MKTLFSLFTFCIFFSLQAQVSWDKTYDFPNGSYVLDMVETTDNGYFVVCNSSYLKINKAGDTLFTNRRHSFSNYDTSFSVCAALPNGEVVLGGQKNNAGYLWILGKNGEIKRSKSFPKTQVVIDLLSHDSLVYALFDIGPALHKTNTHLDSLWYNYKNPTGTPFAMTFDHKGNLIVMTDQYYFSSHSVYDGGSYPPKKSLSGTYPYRRDVITLLEWNNQFYFSDANKLVGISVGFDSISTHVMDSTHHFHFVPEDNGLSVLVSQDPGWIFRSFDATFHSQFSTSFVGKNDFKDDAHLLKDSEGYYLFGGDANYGTDTRLLRYKPEQMVTAFETEAFLEKGSELFPNPAKNEVHLRAESIPAQVTMWNSQGEVVLHEIVGTSPGLLLLNRPSLPAGLYVLEIEEASHQKKRSKLVLE